MQNSLNSALFHKNLRLFLTASEWFGWLINTGSTAQKKDFNYLCHHTQFLFFKYPGDDLHLFIKLIRIASCPFFTSCVVMKACFWHTTNHILLTYIHIHHLCCVRGSALYSPKTNAIYCNYNTPCLRHLRRNSFQYKFPMYFFFFFLICYTSAKSPGGVERSARSHSEGVFCIKSPFESM